MHLSRGLFKRLVGALGVVLCFGVLSQVSCQPQAGTNEPVSDAAANRARRKVKAPAFSLTSLDGRAISLEQMRGKVVLLDFWATWCPPCVISAPELEKLADAYEGRPVVVISVSLDERRDAVELFVERMGISNVVAMAGRSNIDTAYGVSALPMFVLIDPRGYVVNAWNGYHPSLVSTWRQEIDRLLKES